MSRYNEFLDSIEVDNDEIKRDTLRRKKLKEEQQKKVNSSNKLPSKNTQQVKKAPKQQENKKQEQRPVKQKVRLNQGQVKDIRIKSNGSVNSGVKSIENPKNVAKNKQQFRSIDRDIAKLKGSNKSSKKTNQPTQNKVTKHKKFKNVARDRIGEDIDDSTYKFTISTKEYKEKMIGTKRQDSVKYVYLQDDKKRDKAPKIVALLGLYVFILSTVMIYYFSRVGVVKAELREINIEYSKLSEENAELNIKLATAYNIDNLRQRAENELYMNKPEAHQIIYISVVPENYVDYEMELDNE